MQFRTRLLSPFRVVRSYLRHPWPLRLLLTEAFVVLAVARILLIAVPFRRLVGLFSPGCEAQRADALNRERQRRQIAWAIGRAALHLPGQTVCFPRGIAAQIMCRRRGIDTTLYYGARTLPGLGLTAHVWVLDGEFGVVGHEEAGRYHVLATFPPRF